jgi:hypothetical protein
MGSVISVRISRTAAVYWESLPRGEKGKIVNDSLLRLAAKDPRGLAAILRGKSKQAQFHKASLAAINADVQHLTKNRMSSIEEWERAEGEAVDVQDRSVEDGRAEVFEYVRSQYAKRHEKGKRPGQAGDLDWAERVLKEKGRILNMTPVQLLKQLEVA